MGLTSSWLDGGGGENSLLGSGFEEGVVCVGGGMATLAGCADLIGDSGATLGGCADLIGGGGATLDGLLLRVGVFWAESPLDSLLFCRLLTLLDTGGGVFLSTA